MKKPAAKKSGTRKPAPKKAAAKKPAARKAAPKKTVATKAPAKKPAAKKKPAARAPARKGKEKKAAAAKPRKNNAQPPAIEKEVAALLDDYDNGNVGDASDVLPRMNQLDKKLPRTSSLRKDFDAMLRAIEATSREP